MIKELTTTSAAALLMLTTIAVAQQTDLAEDIVAQASNGGDAYLPDFSYAGYNFGIGEIPLSTGRIIDVADHGAVPDDGVDDTAALKAALAEASKTDEPIRVVFGPGTYRLTEIITLDRSDLVIQGAGQGEGGTELHFPRPLAMVDNEGRFEELKIYMSRYDKRHISKNNNADIQFELYSWSGGFFWFGDPENRTKGYIEQGDVKPKALTVAVEGARDSLTMEVANAKRLGVGEWIQVIWYSNEEDSGIVQELYGDTDLEIGNFHWAFDKRSLLRFRTKVAAIDGNTVTLSSPLPHPVGSAVPADIAAWSPVERVGLEDLSITFPDAPSFGHHLERGYNGVYFAAAADSWVRNVTFVNADTGILADDAAHSTFQDIITKGERVAHYGVHMGSVTNVLAERISVYNPVIHSLSFNTKSMRSVYKDSVVWADAVLDQHAGANNQNLFDNTTLYIDAKQDDEGNAFYPLWNGSGAKYWQPGHGRYNTTWNTHVIVRSGATPGQTVRLEGVDEGPNARVVGIYGNKPFTVDYRPAPIVSHINERVAMIPSLYDYQKLQRTRAAAE